MGGRIRVAPELFGQHPDYQAAALIAHNLVNGPSTPESMAMLAESTKEAAQKFSAAQLEEHSHLVAWRSKYASFGCNPRRVFCSAEALLRRTLKRGVPPINRIVDVYNAVSIRHVVPIGGEDLDCVQGDAVLQFAGGREDFVYHEHGESMLAHPDPGEVIWRDNGGVTCRRWNWRQCVRTALTLQTKSAYFLFEAVEPFVAVQLRSAVEALRAALRAVSPGCRFEDDIYLIAGST